MVYKPELQELVYGQISQITNFGAFVNIGALEAMIHISQTMDDYVSFSKSGALIGRNTKRALKKGDLCIARIIAISYKSLPPKIGLTMRQPGLGKIEWIQEEKEKHKLLRKKRKMKKIKFSIFISTSVLSTKGLCSCFTISACISVSILPNLYQFYF